MKFDFDEIIDRRGTHAVKLDAVPDGIPGDTIMAWVADMDFSPPQPVLDAMDQRLKRRIFGYSIYDNPELKTAITGWLRKRHDWIVRGEDVFFCPGIVTALSVLIRILSEPGDGIIVQKPVYMPFFTKVKANGREVCNNPLLNEGGRYSMDYKGLEEHFRNPKVKGMILCNPHNPVGRVWREEELKHVVELAGTYDKWIISDEIHMDLTRRGVRNIPLLKAAPEYAQRIITCTSPTKTFNLAGLNISNIIIPNPDYQRLWNEVMDDQLSLTMASPFAIEATIAAFEEGDEWLDQLREYLDGNFKLVRDFLNTELPAAVLSPAEATYLAWVDLRQYTGDPVVLKQRLLQAGVLFNQGIQFGQEGSCFIRMNLAAPRDRVRLMLERLKQAVDDL